MAQAKQSKEQTKAQPEQRDERRSQEETGLERRGYGDRSMMSPLASSPFTFMRRFGEEMDRLFSDFGFGETGLGRSFPGAGLSRSRGAFGASMWSPQVDVFQREGDLVVRADIPGATRDEINVDVEDNVLTIRGERKQDHEEDREGYYHSERSYGSFYRSIRLPDNADSENAKAKFRDGVLEVTVPMSEQARGRRLEIEGEGQESGKKGSKGNA